MRGTHSVVREVATMSSQPFQLLPFAGTDVLPLAISGTATLRAGFLDVDFRLTGAAQVLFPAPRGAGERKDNLWRSTCCEAFIKPSDSTEYWEYNLAPSGDWNVYRFTDYRAELRHETWITRIAIDAVATPEPRLRAALPVPPPLAGQTLGLALSCVVEDLQGGLHYFALRHCGTKPDFHHPESFCLRLTPTAS